MSDESETEEVTDLSNPDVTTKYRVAGEISQKVLAKVLESCVPDADIGELCEMGDKLMEEETGKLYNKKVKGKKTEKGIAFPTCISVNDMVAHYSPPRGEKVLRPGDIAKVELACHIDGYIAGAGHTIIVGDESVEDKKADVIMAAWTAAEAAVRLVQVGNTNTQVTDAFMKIADDFGVKAVQGVLSHQVKKHVIDGTRTIAGFVGAEDKQEEFEFEMNEVYCIDVAMTSGEGKVKETEIPTTVFKRAVEKAFMLRTAKSRQFISEVNRRFPALPFNLRAIEDAQVARIGVSEAKRHELLEEYPVLRDKEGTTVANFKFTVLLLPGGTKKITGMMLGDLEQRAKSTCSVKDEDLKKVLATSANPKAKKKKSKKGGDKKEDEEKEEEEAS